MPNLSLSGEWTEWGECSTSTIEMYSQVLSRCGMAYEVTTKATTEPSTTTLTAPSTTTQNSNGELDEWDFSGDCASATFKDAQTICYDSTIGIKVCTKEILVFELTDFGLKSFVKHNCGKHRFFSKWRFIATFFSKLKKNTCIFY